MELILSYGYQGFSYNDISKIVKIRKSSIHYYFPAKEDLGIAFIDRYNRMFNLWVKRLGDISRRDQLIEFCTMYSDLSKNGLRICPIGMVAAEYPSMPIKIQEKAKDLILKVEHWLELLIVAGIAAKEFEEDLEPLETSRQIICVMSGALKMARIFKDLSRISNARQMVTKQIFST